jgi:hypothetical protein
MIATKETGAIALASAAVAYAAVFRPRRMNWRAAGIFVLILIVGVWVLTAGRGQWKLLAQSAAAYLERGAAGGVHRHPWFTYLEWMRGEAPILLLAAAGLARALSRTQPAIRFLALYAILILSIYSAIPYKTPWCAVSPLYALALLAGFAVQTLGSRGRILLAAAAACLAIEAWLVSVPYASDPRNPWVYAHTGPGVFDIRDQVAKFLQISEAREQTPIDIYTLENWWPLPWYLRHYPNVRWWRQVVTAGRAAPVVLVSPAMEPELVRKLYEGPPPGERELYMNMFPHEVDLRPGVEVRGYVVKSLWDRQ